jgi:hypothetical protein
MVTPVALVYLWILVWLHRRGKHVTGGYNHI